MDLLDVIIKLEFNFNFSLINYLVIRIFYIERLSKKIIIMGISMSETKHFHKLWL
jgi:hypothetical protein